MGSKIPYTISERRAGDVDTCFADSTKAFKELQLESRKNYRRYVVEILGTGKKIILKVMRIRSNPK